MSKRSFGSKYQKNKTKTLRFINIIPFTSENCKSNLYLSPSHLRLLTQTFYSKVSL